MRGAETLLKHNKRAGWRGNVRQRTSSPPVNKVAMTWLHVPQLDNQLKVNKLEMRPNDRSFFFAFFVRGKSGFADFIWGAKKASKTSPSGCHFWPITVRAFILC